VKQFVISNLSNSPLHSVVKVHGVKPKRIKGDSSDSDDDSTSIKSENDAPIKFTGKYNTTQFVHTRTFIPKSTMKEKVLVKQEKTEADDEKGNIFSLED
jgi:hypothetical protein